MRCAVVVGVKQIGDPAAPNKIPFYTYRNE
jgi:hypothetical protein